LETARKEPQQIMADSVGSGQGTGSRTRDIFGVAVCDLAEADALGMLLDAMADGRHLKLAFLNAHGANLAWGDAELRRMLSAFVVLADGVGVDIAAKALTGAPFAANLNGTDFIPKLIRNAPGPLRIALFGGRPGVAERAAAVLLAQDPRHEISPVADGYGDPEAARRYLAALEAAPADLLLVALGNPLQERWIAAHVDARHAHVTAGVGALFDFVAGEVSRAPESWRRLRLEWLYRLAIEPRRMFRRYVLGNPLFLLRVAMAKLGLRRF
jgi:exopolysaccharide biosynthesis WecB/TagA/CpsF family protein